ncbi:hypothetical protein F2Q68_00023435 [Brassica cretica]|uniref:Uncharacterized protein n=1 Tax=Brassica cretica TaxID=69181 RepID=A0A8S9FZW2_BRACR|nr:hypothetical protein F2Q68_00023435 [Brassica cretica]
MDLTRDVPTWLRLGRSGSRKLSTGCWAQSGYATSLREVAMVQSGCHTSLQWVALHSNRLEWVHQVDDHFLLLKSPKVSKYLQKLQMML